jgi:endonuclease YncB( thermonuclease family)
MNGLKKVLTLVLAAVLILTFIGLSGCPAEPSTPIPKQGMIITRFQDVKGDVYPPSVDHFGPGDTPAVYVYGYGGETVTVEIYDLTTGKLVKTSTDYISQGMANYRWYPDFPAGSYKAVLSVGGVEVASALFKVSK